MWRLGGRAAQSGMTPIHPHRPRLSPRLAWCAVALSVAVAVAVTVVHRSGPGGAPSPVRNVILIVVDTLRADHLGLFGYARDTSPNLTRLARDAIVFERARSQAPCTFPSVNSILTSRHPVAFMGQAGNGMAIPEGVRSLPEILGERGFVSRAVSASEVVRATPSRFNPSGGFGRGFASFDESCPDGPADCVNRRILDLLPGDGAPSFLYVHYMDPHGPYVPPQGHPRRWATTTVANRIVASGDPVAIESTVVRPNRAGGRPLREAERQYLIDLYDDEIAYWDTQLGTLFAELASRGVLEDTMIVLTADHGESFGRHGTLAHCRTLFDAETHVPLVMWIPGVGGRRMSARVENLDLVPTMLDYLGVPAADLDGTSLRGFIEGRSGPPHPFVHSFHVVLRSTSNDRYKGILNVVSGDLKVFDLVADPVELSDMIAHGTASPEVVADLRRELERWTGRHEGARGTAWSAGAAGDVVDRLRGLGYLE